MQVNHFSSITLEELLDSGLWQDDRRILGSEAINEEFLLLSRFSNESGSVVVIRIKTGMLQSICIEDFSSYVLLEAF